MQFVWFWTFWHWSKESFRAGCLLRPPLHGIGGHWDEWFRHEASQGDLEAIKQMGRSEVSQRQFIGWLARHWAREAHGGENRMIPRYVLGQLANVPPFKNWPSFEKYRKSYGANGVSAVVLTEQSRGESRDVRMVEALLLPADAANQPIAPEGFQATAAELDPPLSAAKNLLGGKGLLILLALWMVGGRRPYPRWMSTALTLGWVVVVGLILLLLVGPEPGGRLILYGATLVALWCGLVLTALGVVIRESFCAWRVGADLKTRLVRSQVRLRMNGGLTLKGGSAGLPFCLNTLLALYSAQPDRARRSWIWHRFFRKMRSEAVSWAATGVVTGAGQLTPVVLEPKLRACLQHGEIQHVLTPHQSDGGQRAIQRLGGATNMVDRPGSPAASILGAARLGFAAEKRALRNHSCRHVAQSMMALGGFADRWQMAANVFALVVSAVMVVALPDLRSILLPHPAPIAVPPASSSPYSLWISLDTKHPEYFRAVLESGYWSNRRADVKSYGGVTPSIRAEILLHRITGMKTVTEEDGVVWIERRRRFLFREFYPGDRVGYYSIPYLSHLGHE